MVIFKVKLLSIIYKVISLKRIESLHEQVGITLYISYNSAHGYELYKFQAFE